MEAFVIDKLWFWVPVNQYIRVGSVDLESGVLNAVQPEVVGLFGVRSAVSFLSPTPGSSQQKSVGYAGMVQDVRVTFHGRY